MCIASALRFLLLGLEPIHNRKATESFQEFSNIPRTPGTYPTNSLWWRNSWITWGGERGCLVYAPKVCGLLLESSPSHPDESNPYCWSFSHPANQLEEIPWFTGFYHHPWWLFRISEPSTVWPPSPSPPKKNLPHLHRAETVTPTLEAPAMLKNFLERSWTCPSRKGLTSLACAWVVFFALPPHGFVEENMLSDGWPSFFQYWKNMLNLGDESNFFLRLFEDFESLGMTNCELQCCTCQWWCKLSSP